MDSQNSCVIPDVQGSVDQRHIPIHRVGVRRVRVPLELRRLDGSSCHTVADAALSVNLKHDQKGTHMSRFIHLLSAHRCLNFGEFHQLLDEMITLLEAQEGTIELHFPYFVAKRAPVSGEESLMDYEVTLTGTIDARGKELWLKVLVPVTSLCPCSKQISDYGAHNQRSHVIINALCREQLSIEELLRYAEEEASCELYATLKRPDEKFVTEYAYNHPKFVEDLVRDIAVRLNQDARISAYRIFSENFESIHNHSAFAIIEGDKRA